VYLVVSKDCGGKFQLVYDGCDAGDKAGIGVCWSWCGLARKATRVEGENRMGTPTAESKHHPFILAV